MSDETQKATRKDSLETKQRLVDAAERLFAEQGVDRVKLVDVSKAAGQKNRNAAQYHFGDRAGLINAVLNRHTDLIAEQRRDALEKVEQHNVTMKALVAVLVLPVVHHVRSDPNGLTFLRLNRQLVSSGDHIALSWKRTNDMPEVQQLQLLMKGLMVPHSKEAMRAKMILVQCMLFHGLANFYELMSLSEVDAFVDTLCLSIEAVLLAQHS